MADENKTPEEERITAETSNKETSLTEDGALSDVASNAPEDQPEVAATENETDGADEIEEVKPEIRPDKKEKVKPEKVKPVQEVQQKKVQQKKQPEKKVKRNKAREVFLELKNVTWPTFGKVVKQTATVLVVTVFFMLILLAIDQLLGLGHRELIDRLTESSVSLLSATVKPIDVIPDLVGIPRLF